MPCLLRMTALAAALSLSLMSLPTLAADAEPAEEAPADSKAAPAQAAPSAQTPTSTPGGKATFLLPEGWGQRVAGQAVVLTPPEADGSRFAILDSGAEDADAAVAEGWKLLKLTPKFVVATDAAPRDGWEQRRFYEYDVPQNAKRAVSAAAYRNDKSWTVVVVDFDQAIAEKRGSQFSKLFQRLQPAGYTRENFAGRTAHKLDDARLKKVSDFIEKMRKDFEVPGVSIGIVQSWPGAEVS